MGSDFSISPYCNKEKILEDDPLYEFWEKFKIRNDSADKYLNSLNKLEKSYSNLENMNLLNGNY